MEHAGTPNNDQQVLQKVDELRVALEHQAAELVAVTEKLQAVMATLERIERGTSKMESHINFVDGVYEKVEAPFMYMCDKVRMLAGRQIEQPAAHTQIEEE